MPSAKMANCVSAPPEKSRKERERAALLVGAVPQHLDGVDVDAGRRDVGPDAVQHEHGQRERDLVPQVLDPEHVQDACSSHCFSLRSPRADAVLGRCRLVGPLRSLGW